MSESDEVLYVLKTARRDRLYKIGKGYDKSIREFHVYARDGELWFKQRYEDKWYRESLKNVRFIDNTDKHYSFLVDLEKQIEESDAERDRLNELVNKENTKRKALEEKQKECVTKNGKTMTREIWQKKEKLFDIQSMVN